MNLTFKRRIATMLTRLLEKTLDGISRTNRLLTSSAMCVFLTANERRQASRYRRPSSEDRCS